MARGTPVKGPLLSHRTTSDVSFGLGQVLPKRVIRKPLRGPEHPFRSKEHAQACA
jgi:hypothetical protein